MGLTIHYELKSGPRPANLLLEQAREFADGGALAIQRYDELEVFASDESAINFVHTAADNGHPLAKLAVQELAELSKGEMPVFDLEAGEDWEAHSGEPGYVYNDERWVLEGDDYDDEAPLD